MSLAYYSEHDEYSAHWLRNLIAEGRIAPGVVDTRDIRDVLASDLKGFTQVHMFAGVGVWSYALRQAGWDDSREIWTGSCPCQPFSAAGRGGAFTDERHLWPAFRRLIATCKPPIVLGEQVASKVALEWVDEVAWDLENVSLWGSFYENMQSVQDAAAAGELPEIFRQIAGRASTALQTVPAGIRKNVAVAEPGIPGGGSEKTSRPEQSILGSISVPQPRGDLGEGVHPSSDQEGLSLRSGIAPERDRKTSPKRRLRNDGGPSRNCPGETPMEFPIDRSDDSGIGLYVREYTHRLFCDECRSRELGRKAPSRDVEILVRERLANDERGLAVAFEGFLASKDGLGWLDLVSTDMEGAGYAFGATDLCAAGIGVEWQESQSGEWLRRAIHDCIDPVVRSMLCDFADWAGAGNIDEGGNHIRQRLYFVGLADAGIAASGRDAGTIHRTETSIDRQNRHVDGPDVDGHGAGRNLERLADADGRDARAEREQSGGQYGQQPGDRGAVERLADPMPAGRPERGTGAGSGQTAGLRAAGRMDDDDDARPQGHAGDDRAAGREGPGGPVAAPGVSVRLADTTNQRRLGGWSGQEGDQSGAIERSERLCDAGGTDATDGRRYAKDWLFCRDDRWRAVEPRTFPLAHGATARVGKLRAYGNALDAETATRFCETVKEICDG